MVSIDSMGLVIKGRSIKQNKPKKKKNELTITLLYYQTNY